MTSHSFALSLQKGYLEGVFVTDKQLKSEFIMMQQLIDTLHTGHYSLVVLHEGRQRSFGGQGVRNLYDISTQEPELLLGAKLADKAVGRTAAKIMAEGGVAEVYADYISQQAYDLLSDAKVKVSYGKKVDHATFLDIWKKLGEIE